MAKKTVLAGVSSPEIFEYLTRFIPLLGDYTLERASDGLDVFAKINALPVDFLILDLSLPNMKAHSLLRQTKKLFAGKSLLIASSEADAKKVREEGWETITAPVDLTQMSELIKRGLPREPAPGPKRESARLLIADDEPFINEYLKHDFETLGIEVHTACDGERALQVFKNKNCNMAIVDLRMPKMTGTELIHELEASAEPPKVIIVVTAALGDTLKELKRLGYPLFDKPMDTDKLKNTILDACRKYGLVFKN